MRRQLPNYQNFYRHKQPKKLEIRFKIPHKFKPKVPNPKITANYDTKYTIDTSCKHCHFASRKYLLIEIEVRIYKFKTIIVINFFQIKICQ